MSLKVSDLVKLGLAPFLVYLSNYVLDSFFHPFYQAYQLDTYFHILGGMAIAGTILTGIALAERLRALSITRPPARFFLVLAFTALSAVLWEFYEYINDYFFMSAMQTSNADTMKDLFLGLAGGTFWYGISRFWTKK